MARSNVRMTLKPVYRITTFVPSDKLQALLAGVGSVVSLEYGCYDQVAWSSAEGIEQFRPLPGSNPRLGKQGEIARVPSVRVEFVIDRDPTILDRVLTLGLIPNHPWEEPAVFVDEASVTLTQALTARKPHPS